MWNWRMLYCPYCLREVAENARRCPHCGAELSEEEMRSAREFRDRTVQWVGLVFFVLSVVWLVYVLSAAGN